VTDHYDVLVIGSGPGGATTAARVAETGKRVLMLERGDFLPRERDNWNSRAVFGGAKYTADETFYDLPDRPFRPELHYCVGGNSKVYGAALLRLLPGDFGEVRHPAGVAPAWPLSYDDMEPYYVRAEHLGVLSKLGMADTTFVRTLYLHKAFDAAATAHQAGTARFGTDPAASVLDVHCKAHDLDNLYVVDGSFMRSIGAVKPTLTIIANALRIGDHIARRIGTIP
jgi:choline dehydrogenase-like flavoprotein